MAFSGIGSNGARGRGRWRGVSSLSEMNVVPLVDVVLVLLIIFMVTASAMEFGLVIQVPKTKATSTAVLKDAPTVSISQSGTTYLGDRPTNINELLAEIRRRYPDAKDVIVRADKDLTLEPYFQVIAELGTAKFNVKVVARAEDLRQK
jgi:biopolymer transport protein TolR